MGGILSRGWPAYPMRSLTMTSHDTVPTSIPSRHDRADTHRVRRSHPRHADPGLEGAGRQGGGLDDEVVVAEPVAPGPVGLATSVNELAVPGEELAVHMDLAALAQVADHVPVERGLIRAAGRGI